MTKSTGKYLPRGHARKLIVDLLRTSPNLTVPEILIAFPEMSQSVANNTITRMFNEGVVKVTGTRKVQSKGKSKPYSCKVYALTRMRVSSAKCEVKPKVEPVLELTEVAPEPLPEEPNPSLDTWLSLAQEMMELNYRNDKIAIALEEVRRELEDRRCWWCKLKAWWRS